MGKLIRALAKSQDEAQQRQQQGLLIGPDGRPLPPDQQLQLQGQQQQPLDPSQLDFCRLLYDYVPDTAASGGALTPGLDLEVKKGDLVAILSKSDPMGNASEWWRCRARDGGVGYLPSPYLEVIQRRPKEIGPATPPGSRTATMVGGRAQTMSTDRADSLRLGVGAGKGGGPVITGKAGDISVESFQKSQFYS